MTPHGRQRVAEFVSSVLGPVPMGLVLGLAVGVHSGRGLFAGAGWGLLSVACAAVLPALATAPLRRREARTRRHRLAYMLPAVAGALIGLAILWLTPAPADIRVLAAGFALGLVTSAALNTVYASSNHVAALAGGVALAGVLLSPWALLGAAAIGLQGWSRVDLGLHTRQQVVAGAVLGAASAGIAIWLSV